MPALTSAGLLMYSLNENKLKVFLVHPGGPFYVNKDDGYWGIPKGLPEENENLLDAAIREFQEETGIIPQGEYLPLGSVKQKNGKTVYAWAFKIDMKGFVEIMSNTFEIEWPPHSGKKQHFPEIDKGEFFTTDAAKKKIVGAQMEFITKLEKYISS